MAIKKLTTTTANSGSIFTTGNITTGTTTANPYYWGTTTTGTSTGISNLTITPNTLVTSNNTISWTDGNFMNSDIIEYIDIFYQFMGIDMDYERFSKMTKEEKKGFIRDLKLQKIIDDK
jgi:hypothetical protein